MALLGNLTGSSQFFNDTAFYNGVATTSYRNEPAVVLTKEQDAPTSSKIMSMGGWIKRNKVGHYSNVFSGSLGGSGVPQAFMYIDNTNNRLEVLCYNGSAYVFRYMVSRKFRDVSAWYHLWLQIDSTEGNNAAADRVKIYVNGVRETTYDDTPTNIADGTPDIRAFNEDGIKQYFGHTNASYGGHIYYSDWYFIDGLAVSPVDTVGEFKNGIFIPKEYTPTEFGNNGFHLKFDQTGVGSPSATTIGADSSGKANHFTSTEGTNVEAHDCAMPDSPENNFSTWNALFKGGEQTSSIYADATLSNGNLEVSVPQNSYMGNTFRPTSGKWYCEIRVKTIGSTNGEIDWGWLQATTYAGTSGHSGQANKWGAYYHAYSTDHIQVYDETSQLGSNINLTISAGNVLQLAWDIDNNKGWVGINNTYYAADNGTDGNPSAGTNQTFTFTDDEAQNLQCYIANGTGTDVHVANFGQDSTFAGAVSAGGNADANGIGDFAYAPPSGFLALCSANLPEPTIGPNSATQADDHFNTVLYTGDGSSNKVLTGFGFQPDWVWQKTRSASHDHFAMDSSRGANAYLKISLASAEATATNFLKSFDSDGVTIGDDGVINGNGVTNVMWNWKANGGTTSSNTDGSITSTVQANTTAGFSIVTYTGTGASATVGHGLGVAPTMIIFKNRSNSNNWTVYNKANGNTNAVFLNLTNANSTGITFINSTTPSSTIFNLLNVTNSNGGNNSIIAYCFHDVEGYSKFGSYTGNGSTDGTFVHLGFRPAFLMYKRTDSTGNWLIDDNKTQTFNPDSNYLLADSSDAEGDTTTNTAGHVFDMLSNGFKMRNTNSARNASGGTFIYMAFAEAPFKYANAR